MPEQKISDQLWDILWDLEHGHSVDTSREKMLERLKPVLDRITALENTIATARTNPPAAPDNKGD